MDKILQQLGGLVLGAVPTVILFVLLWLLYDVLVHRPLVRVLAERHAKTAGAVEQARADIAAADAKTAQYEERMREAKLTIYKYQESRRQKSLEARSTALGEARAAAEARIKQAREAIEHDAAQVKERLQTDAESLAHDVIRTILKPAGLAQSPAAGGRE